MTVSLVDDARAAIAVLGAALARLDDDTQALQDAVARFDHEEILRLSLKSERTTEELEQAQPAAIEAVAACRDAGRAAHIDDDVKGLVAAAGRLAALRARTAMLILRARHFTRAHQQALLPTTTPMAYGRTARAAVDRSFTSVRTTG